jgi:acyl-CoA thioester hydrolase
VLENFSSPSCLEPFMSAPMPVVAPAEFPFFYDDKVRFSDLDVQGHCNNAAISGFFESARVAMLDSLGMSLTGKGMGLAIVRQVIEYRHELLLGTVVRTGVRIEKLGKTSITMTGAVFAAAECMATNEVVGVLLDLGTRGATAIPDDMRAAVSRYMTTATP